MQNAVEQLRAIPFGRILVACLGLTLALFGTNISQIMNRPWEDAQEVIVQVNQQLITRKQVDMRAQRVWDLPFSELGVDQKRWLIELLIDEELLLQRAEDRQIVRNDPGLRKALVAAAIDQVVMEFRQQAVTDEQLLSFYRQHQKIFQSPLKVAIDAIRFDPSVDASKIELLLANGQSLRSIAEQFKHRSLAPREPLSVPQLHRLLGAKRANMVLALDESEVSRTLQSADGAVFYQVTEIQLPQLDTFHLARDRVVGEYHRRGRELALDDKLNHLWRRAMIKSQFVGRHRR